MDVHPRVVGSSSPKKTWASPEALEDTEVEPEVQKAVAVLSHDRPKRTASTQRVCKARLSTGRLADRLRGVAAAVVEAAAASWATVPVAF